jgi:hypothetical protein
VNLARVLASGPLPLLVIALPLLAVRAESPAIRIEPALRNQPSIVFEDARNRVLLFGGWGTGDGVLGDAWELSGTGWTELTVAGPPARGSQAMSYDSRRHVAVVFGGETVRRHGARNETVYLADTWEWNGKTWRMVAHSGPAARTACQLAYDARRGRTVLFGGLNATMSLNDTWEWDGHRWRQVALSGPPARFHHVMAFDAARRRVVLCCSAAGRRRPASWPTPGSGTGYAGSG